MESGFRRAIYERNRLREELAKEMNAQSAKFQRGVRLKKLFFVSCLVGVGVAIAQRTKGISIPKTAKLNFSSDDTQKLLTQIQEQLKDQKGQMIGGERPTAKTDRKGPEYEPRSLPLYVEHDAAKGGSGGEYLPAGALQLELVKRDLGKKPATAFVSCNEKYFALTPAQAAGLPPQYQRRRREPAREDYDLISAIPISYLRDEREFPK